MKKILIYFLIFIGIVSCKKEEPFKNVNLDSLKEKEWFQKLELPCDENAICKTRINIFLALYNNVPVVYSILTSSDPLCDFPAFFVQLHNLNGEVVKSYTEPGQLAVFNKEVTHSKLIYSCGNY